jgi:hypothetical protein
MAGRVRRNGKHPQAEKRGLPARDAVCDADYSSVGIGITVTVEDPSAGGWPSQRS